MLRRSSARRATHRVALLACAAFSLGNCDAPGAAPRGETTAASQASRGSGGPAIPASARIERRELGLASGLEVPDERDNLSGAACSPTGTCLLIGDEMRFARFFALSDAMLTPTDPMFLLPARSADGKKTKESDGEGVAFDAGYFYVIGSHSANKEGKPQPSRHFVARFRVDPRTGKPADFGTDERPSMALERVDLDYLLASDPLLAAHAKERPGEGGEHGPNIEGVAVRNGTIFIGFRGPVDGAGAALYSLPVEALFQGRKPQAPPIRLKLDADGASPAQGVRDLAAVSDGLLILVGPEMRADAPRPELWHRSGNGDLRRVARLGDFGGDSPEAIAVLSETGHSYRLLVLSDGDRRSPPMLLDVPKLSPHP